MFGSMRRARPVADSESTRRQPRADGAAPSRLQTALTVCLMFAAAAQGVIAQAHVHFRFERSATVGVVLVSAPGTTHGDGAPGDQAGGDSSACALCQVLASGAAPLGPAPRFSMPFSALRHVLPAQPARPVTVGAVSHNWTSRGPPSV